jgi:hypothetical protein
VLGCIGEDLYIRLDAPFNLFLKDHVLIEHVLDGRDDAIIDGAADGAVSYEALEGFTFIVLFHDALFHLVQIDAIQKMGLVLMAQVFLDHGLSILRELAFIVTLGAGRAAPQI